MIQLNYGPITAQRKSVFNVQAVVYNRLADIPQLLKNAESLSAPTGRGEPATSVVPVSPPVDHAPPEEEEELHALEDGEGELTVEHPVDVEDVAQVINADYITTAPTEPTAEEIAAARTIAEAYQRYHAHNVTNRRSSEETRRRIFDSFSAHAVKMDWPKRYYRMLFLGPVPHLYIVVEGMKNHLYSARSIAKKRLNVVAHLELENTKLALNKMK